MGAYSDLSESDIQRRMLELKLEDAKIHRQQLVLKREIVEDLATKLAESGGDTVEGCSMDCLRLQTELSSRGAAVATEGAQLRTELALRKT